MKSPKFYLRHQMLAWLFLIVVLGGSTVKTSGHFALKQGVSSSVGTEFPADFREATERWLRAGDAETLFSARLHTMSGLAAIWLRSVDMAQVNHDAMSEVVVSSKSQTLIQELLESQVYSRTELGALLAPELSEVVRNQCPVAEQSLARICREGWLAESRQVLVENLFELLSTEVDFAAEVRLGDRDLGLEASDALCDLMIGDLETYEFAQGVVSSLETGTRQHSLGLMALSCAYPEQSMPYLLELVGSEDAGDEAVIAILELARVVSHRSGSFIEVSSQFDVAIESATPTQAAVFSVARQILEGE